jgi:phosphoribosylformylglycinamidine synthase
VSESASRALVSVDGRHRAGFAEAAAAAGVPAARLGVTGGDALVVDAALRLGIDRLRDAYEGAIPRALGERP